MEEERLDRLILLDISEFEADNDPVPAPLVKAAMEVAIIKPAGHARQTVVKQQADRAEKVGFARPVLANNRVHTVSNFTVARAKLR